MSKVEGGSLAEVQDQLQAILEGRITELMTEIKATQAVARQIGRTEEEVERQRKLRAQFESELAPLREEADSLQAEVTSLQTEIDAVLENLKRMRAMHEQLTAMKSGSIS